jgi:hypothetical protein
MIVADLAGLAEVGWAVRQRGLGHDYLRALIDPVPGRSHLTPRERRLLNAADGLLRSGRVGCLNRAAILTEFLRRRGVAARIRLTVSAAQPNLAHAETEVGGEPLRPDRPDHVVLR